MRRPHPDAAVLAAALLGVLLLHAAAAATAPRHVPLHDVAAHEGGRIAVEGLVVDVRHGERGRFLQVAADGLRLPIVAGRGDGPHAGDRVRAIGLVTRLDAGLGLSLERLDVLAPRGSAVLVPSDLATRPRDFEGARVRVEGEARGGELAADGARLRLAGEPPPSAGWWVAEGDFTYDASRAAYVLRVGAWTRS